MKRGGPLERRASLKAKKGLETRTPLRTRKPLRSGGGLARGEGLSRSGGLDRELPAERPDPVLSPEEGGPAAPEPKLPKVRARLRARSKKKARERGAEEAFRVFVIDRACERCERCACAQPLEAHHVVPRGRARGHPLLHDPRNGAALCARCHRKVHGQADLEDRDRWLKSARALDEMQEGQRLAEVDPALVLAFQGSDGMGPLEQTDDLATDTKENPEMNAPDKYDAMTDDQLHTAFRDFWGARRREDLGGFVVFKHTVEPRGRMTKADVDRSLKMLGGDMTTRKRSAFRSIMREQGALRVAPTSLPAVIQAVENAHAQNPERPVKIRLTHRGAEYEIAARKSGQYAGKVVLLDVTNGYKTAGVLERDPGAALELKPWAPDVMGAAELCAQLERGMEGPLGRFQEARGLCGLCATPVDGRAVHAECEQRFGLVVAAR